MGAEVGLPRTYGYGAAMGAWALDYLEYWAGHGGFLRHLKTSFRASCYEGDVTFVDAEVVAKQADSAWGGPLVTVRLTMTNQDGEVLVTGVGDVEIQL